MALVRTGRDLVQRVRYYIQDEGADAWSTRQVLEAIDDAFQGVTSMRRIFKQSYDIDYRDTTLADDWRMVSEWTYEFAPPITYQSINQIEGFSSINEGFRVITAGDIDWTVSTLEAFGSANLIWTPAGPGFPGRIWLTGGVDRYTHYRIWFIRRYPSLAFSGSSVSTRIVGSGSPQSTVTLPATADGEIQFFDDAYTGMQIVFETSGQMRTVVGYVGSTRVVTLDSPVTITTSEAWTLVLPIEPEYSDFVALKAANRLGNRAGNSEYMRSLGRDLDYEEQRMKEAMSQRYTNKPLRLRNSRNQRLR